MKGTLPTPVCVDRSLTATSGGRKNDYTVIPLDYCFQNKASFRDDRDNESLKSGTERDVNGEKIVIYSNKATELQNSSTTSKQDMTLYTQGHSLRRSFMEEINRRIDDNVDDVDENGSNLDHGDRWPTSFWTQFCVLSHRTFKQSLPIILSKLNLVQVCTKKKLNTKSLSHTMDMPNLRVRIFYNLDVSLV